jgi:hypothetical protein
MSEKPLFGLQRHPALACTQSRLGNAALPNFQAGNGSRWACTQG